MAKTGAEACMQKDEPDLKEYYEHFYQQQQQQLLPSFENVYGCYNQNPDTYSPYAAGGFLQPFYNPYTYPPPSYPLVSSNWRHSSTSYSPSYPTTAPFLSAFHGVSPDLLMCEYNSNFTRNHEEVAKTVQTSSAAGFVNPLSSGHNWHSSIIGQHHQQQQVGQLVQQQKSTPPSPLPPPSPARNRNYSTTEYSDKTEDISEDEADDDDDDEHRSIAVSSPRSLHMDLSDDLQPNSSNSTTSTPVPPPGPPPAPLPVIESKLLCAALTRPPISAAPGLASRNDEIISSFNLLNDRFLNRLPGELPQLTIPRILEDQYTNVSSPASCCGRSPDSQTDDSYRPVKNPKKYPQRTRKSFNQEQVNILENAFQRNQYVYDKEELADTVGITINQVKTWFQNRRMREKKKMTKIIKEAKEPKKMFQYENAKMSEIPEEVNKPLGPSYRELENPYNPSQDNSNRCTIMKMIEQSIYNAMGEDLTKPQSQQ